MSRAFALLPLLTLSSPAAAQSLATGSAPGIPWVRLLFSLVFCIALAWGVVVAIRHYQRRGMANPVKRLLDRQGTPAPRRIAIIETRRASLHADLCLVECDGEAFFLALSPAGATVLNHRKEPEDAE